MIDIEEKFLSIIHRILDEHVPNCEVRAFGSRVKGTARRFSDLDIALLCEVKLDWREIESLKDAFSVSDLPFSVDVVDWNSISDDFKVLIENNYELLKTKTDLRA